MSAIFSPKSLFNVIGHCRKFKLIKSLSRRCTSSFTRGSFRHFSVICQFQIQDPRRSNSLLCAHVSNLRLCHKFSSSNQDEENNSEEFAELLQEIAVQREAGELVPESITSYNLERLSALSRNQKKNFLRFLHGTEQKKKNKKLKAQHAREQREEQEPVKEFLEMKNVFLQRIEKKQMNALHDWKLASAMKFGPEVVIDFSYDHLMNVREEILMIQQLHQMISSNRLQTEPFHIHWNNLKKGSPSMKEIERVSTCGAMDVNRIMVSMSENDVIDNFPKEKLVYLTADSPNIMDSFDHDRVYIIGGLVDKSSILTGTTLAKAKRLNIDHVRLPLDRYLQWEKSAKNLTLNQVLDILITLKGKGDWAEALAHVPTRKHSGFRSANLHPQKLQRSFKGGNRQKYSGHQIDFKQLLQPERNIDRKKDLSDPNEGWDSVKDNSDMTTSTSDKSYERFSFSRAKKR